MHRIRRARLVTGVAAATMLSILGCNEQKPPPTFYTDLGDEGTLLLPTSSPRVDPRMKDGRADWHPFRDPDSQPARPQKTEVDRDSPDGAATIANSGALEQQIREAIDEYNGLLDDGKLEDLLEFFDEADAAVVERLTTTIPALSGKISELNDALPSPDASLSAAASALTLASVLRLNVESITITGEREGVAALKTPLSGANETSTAPDVLFTLGEDDYWYVKLSALSSLAPQLDALDRGVAALEQVITDVKSGQVSGDAVAEQVSLAGQMASLFTAVDNDHAEAEAPRENPIIGAGTPDDDTDAQPGG